MSDEAPATVKAPTLFRNYISFAGACNRCRQSRQHHSALLNRAHEGRGQSLPWDRHLRDSAGISDPGTGHNSWSACLSSGAGAGDGQNLKLPRIQELI